MIKRVFWLGLGLAAGVVVARQVQKTVRAYTPSSLAGTARNSAAGLIGTVRDFVADVREGMAEREEQIHEAFAQGANLAELEEFDRFDQFDNDGDDAPAGWADREDGNGARARR